VNIFIGYLDDHEINFLCDGLQNLYWAQMTNFINSIFLLIFCEFEQIFALNTDLYILCFKMGLM